MLYNASIIHQWSRSVSIPKVVSDLMDKYGVYDGNAITPLQLSTFVRPTSEVMCNGFINPPGHLRNFNFKTFHKYPEAQRLIEKYTPDERCVVYLWRRSVSYSHAIVYGITIAKPDNVIIKSIPMGKFARYRDIVKALEQAAKLRH